MTFRFSNIYFAIFIRRDSRLIRMLCSFFCFDFFTNISLIWSVVNLFAFTCVLLFQSISPVENAVSAHEVESRKAHGTAEHRERNGAQTKCLLIIPFRTSSINASSDWINKGSRLCRNWIPFLLSHHMCVTIFPFKVTRPLTIHSVWQRTRRVVDICCRCGGGNTTRCILKIRLAHD